MTDTPEIHWQPIGQLALLAEMVDGLLEETQAFYATLAQARGWPHVLDDAPYDRAARQYRERAYWLNVYDEQFRRWQALPLTPEQRQEVERLVREVGATRPAVRQVLELVEELCPGILNRVRERSAAEAALAELIGVPTRDDS